MLSCLASTSMLSALKAKPRFLASSLLKDSSNFASLVPCSTHSPRGISIPFSTASFLVASSKME